MAKRKKKNSFKKYVGFIPLMLAIIVLGLMLLDVVKYTGVISNADKTFSGFEVMFGLTQKSEVLGVTIETEILSFSFLALLAAILPLCGGVVQLSNNKIMKLVAGVLSLAGAILLFIMPNFVVFATDSMAKLYSLTTSSVAIGAIIAGITACIETVVIGYELLSK